ncbi:rhomboid family intramembrane serine protease [bacterium]|nr:rhomboid family intramembrane serine protease [bacterium]
MVLPIGDAPNPKGFPFVNYLIIAANVAVFLLFTVPLEGTRASASDPRLAEYVREMSRALAGRVSASAFDNVSLWDLAVFNWGFRPAYPSVVDLFSSMFMHAGFMHLFGNMLFLWIYGDNVEHTLGRFRYLFVYLACGVSAVLFHWAFAPQSLMPMVGASGAISGALGFYFLAFPRNKVRLLWLMPPLMSQVVEVSARMVLGFYLVMENFLPFMAARGEGGVAHGAHIGGFLAGLAFAWWYQRRELATPSEFRETGAPAEAIPASRFGAALAEGRFAEVAREYFSLPEAEARRALAPGEALELGEWLRKSDHAKAALAVLRRSIKQDPYSPDAARLELLAGLVLLEDLHLPTEAFQHLRTALDRQPDAFTASRARRALEAIDGMQKFGHVGHLRTPRPW